MDSSLNLMKRYFHEKLETVRSHLMLMGERSSASVSQAMKALIDGDIALAEKVIDSDAEVNALENQIDDEVARYISLRAPVARDLRLLFVAIKASHDLERVGDEATSIAKRLRKICVDGHSITEIGKIPRMCEIGLGMLRDALHCFIDEDSSLAITLWKRDKEVDNYNRQNLADFIEIMKSDSNLVLPYTELVFISKSMERIADHAKNIAEEVYFLLEAKDLKAIVKGDSAAKA